MRLSRMLSMSPAVVCFPKSSASRCFSSLLPISTMARWIHDGETVQRAWAVTTDRHPKSLMTLRRLTSYSWASRNKEQHLMGHQQRGVVRFNSKDTRAEIIPVTILKDSTISSPVFAPLALAVVVFDDAYFYIDERLANMYREIRASVLGTMTVKDVYDKYGLSDKESVRSGLKSFANAIGALEDRVLKYYHGFQSSIEEILAKEEFIDFTSGKDLTIFKERRLIGGQEVLISQDIFHRTMTTLFVRRASPLGLVLGSSGSGKTFFSLQCLANQFLTTTTATKVTLYIHAQSIPVTFTTGEGVNSHTAAKEVVQHIKDKLADAASQEIQGNLNMHVCVVIDEVGSTTTKSWFEDPVMLSALCHEVKKLATNVAVVVAGTGLTGRLVNSTTDAYIFRMKPWGARDVKLLLDQQRPHLYLQEDKSETTDTVANAIFANSKLGALATNARVAYFMVKAIAELSPAFTRDSWRLQLYDWTPTIFANVVARYIESNGIRELNLNQRRLVAARLFQALDEIKPKDDKLPSLFGLRAREISCAESLLQYNVDLVRGKEERLIHEGFAVTVTPAIAVVLYAMAGVGTTLMNGWRGEVELAALYAVRQLMLKYMAMFSSKGQENDLSRDELQEVLASIRLVALSEHVQPIQEREAQDKPILLPIVGKDTVLMNRDKAAFADVIAPYMLIQAKQQPSKKKKAIELYNELQECCLLSNTNGNENDPHYDTRLLQGLVEVWRGNLQPRRNDFAKREHVGLQPKDHPMPQCSKAFPENLLHLVPEVENVEYARIVGNDIIIGNTKRPLPSLDGTKITFVLSTNLNKLRLHLSPTGDRAIPITEKHLNDDLTIKVDMLREEDKLAWTTFVDEIREGVQIKFLLTRSVLSE